jgi:hypothetical protein
MKTWMSLALVLFALSGCEDAGAIAGGEDAGPIDAGGAVDAEQPAGDAVALDAGAVALDAGAEPMVAYLSPTQHLLRASMVLRGFRPTLEEYAAVEADPEAIAGIVMNYVDTPEFGESLRDLENETLLLRAQLFQLTGNGSLEGVRPAEMLEAMTESPLRTIEWVVMNDRPYTDIVQVDFQVGDAQAALVWQGLAEYDPEGPELQPLRHVDGRPAAGILSDGALMYRHRSAGINYHRGRANAMSRALLCFDFLAQDIILDEPIDLSDPEAVANAVVANPNCATCHQALDPLASFFWVNKANWGAGQLNFPLQFHSPNRTDIWREATGRPPGYFGLGGTTLEDLGRHMAADPRFAQCTAKRFYAYFAQVPLETVPFEVVAPYQQAFVDWGHDAKALAVAVVLSDAFRTSHSLSDAGADDLVGYKKARPAQLDRLFRGLTGLRWQTDLPGDRGGIIDLSTSHFHGFRVLGGGIDSYYVQKPIHTMNTTASLFLGALAQQAASKVAAEDLAVPDPAQRRLLRTLPEGDPSGEAGVRAQLAELQLLLYGERVEPDAEAVDEMWALFADLQGAGADAERSWALTLTALFQDFRIAHY